MTEKRLWYEEWFDSPFYHILYGHRDANEARDFIKNLIQYLQPGPSSHFLDLACGKGRHAVEIHNLGYSVHGMDLSKNSIEEALSFETENLQFSVGDMREIHHPNTYDYIFNLFTSFGYFNTVDDHYKTIASISAQLKKGGILVLDYVNVGKVEQQIGSGVYNEVVHQGIRFEIRKEITSKQILKHINFKVNTETFSFTEHIWRLHLSDFNKLFENSGLEMQTIFGDYQLNTFEADKSERLILVVRKK